jgi:hypothetical protein
MAEYEEAMEENPEIDEIFTKHVEEHLHNLLIKQQNGLDSTGATDPNSMMGMMGGMGMGMNMGLNNVQMDTPEF